MRTVFYAKYLTYARAVAAGVVLWSWCGDAQAQLERKWLDKGSFHHWFSEAAAEPFMTGLPGLQWPGIVRYSDNNRVKSLWIGVKNFEDAEENEYAVRVATVRLPASARESVTPLELSLISRFEPTTVTVDGFESFDKPVLVDDVDPTIKADRMIHNVVNSILGITVERTVMQFSQKYHDNYHVYDYTFTNTGNTDGDEEIELPDQVLEDVVFFFFHRHAMNAQIGAYVSGGSWGRSMMTDYILDDNFPEYFEPDDRGYFSWAGYSPYFTRWNSIGGPLLDDGYFTVPEGDTLGRLSAAHFLGSIELHADTSPTDRTDDPSQPSTMNRLSDEDLPPQGEDRFNVPIMLLEYEYMTGGRTVSQGDVVEPPQPGVSWHERFANQTNNPDLGSPGGWGLGRGYGPYTLRSGESIRIVFAEGIAGLNPDARLEIGRGYKAALEAGNPNAPIEYDADGNGTIEADEVMSKNRWVMTARDSLFQTYQRIKAHYEAGFEGLPQPPLPPSEFHVMSGTDEISLEWSTFPDATQQGFEIWRVSGRFEDLPAYELIAELPGTARSYVDQDVSRGIGYFYYIQAVGDPADNTGAMLTPAGVPLKSSRYYAQTYSPAFLKRSPGSTLAASRVVPNPYNLASSQEVRWLDDRDRIGFLDIPGNSTIQIFTELGELVHTIEHTDGSGDAYWNLTTLSNQVIATGIYFAVIKDNGTGEQIIRKFAVIR